MGAITERVATYVPATYQAMITNGDPLLFSAEDLQALADFVKVRLLGAAGIVDEADEGTVYSDILVTFLAKLTTIQYIPAAIDYWDSRLASEVVPGEVQQFRDHTAGLEALFKMLSDEVAQDWLILSPGLGYAKKTWLPKVSYGDGGRGIFLTPDPMDFDPVEFCSTSWANLIPWKVDA